MGKLFSATAVPKCQDRLTKVKRALYQCRNSKTFIQFESGWSEFLIHAGSVLNALEAGSNHTAQGRQWYGKIKRDCRQDPLVRYLHQARNSEEHDALGTSRCEPGGVAFKASPTGMMSIGNLTIDDDFFENPVKALREGVTVHEGSASIKIVADRPSLRTVHYRDVAFQPPTEHMGKKLESLDPLAIGELYIEYLEELVRRATLFA